MRLFHFVGPPHLIEGPERPIGLAVSDAGALRRALEVCAEEQPRAGDPVTVTFTVGADGVLRVAPRRSEHVDCAGREPVQAAGELTFEVGALPTLVEATNQSTGFCPDVGTWAAVAAAVEPLADIRIDAYTREYAFRLCVLCGGINIVKDAVYSCACGADLPPDWNFAQAQSSSRERR